VTKQFVFWAAAEGALHDLCGAVLFGSFTALCFVFARRFSGNRQKKWAVYTAVSGMLVLLSFYCMQRHRLFEIFRGGHTALQRAARENLHHGRLRMGRCIFRSPAHLRG